MYLEYQSETLTPDSGLVRPLLKNRRKRFQLLLVAFQILFIAIFYGNALSQENLPKLVKKIQPAVVTVIVYDAERKVQKQGSGFFIHKDGLFITNYHVLGAGLVDAIVETADGRQYPVVGIVVEDKAGDLVVGAVNPPPEGFPSLKIRAALPEAGERVVVVGSPLGLEQTISDGVVSGIRQVSGVGEILQISAPISPGSSGSPVVNLKGEVVGVATLQLAKGQNLNFAMPGYRVLALARRAAQSARTPPTQGRWIGPPVPIIPEKPRTEKGPEPKVEPQYGVPKVGQIVNANFPKALSDEDAKYLGLAKAEAFTLKDMQSPYVLVEQFNNSCPHCMHQAPILNQLYNLVQQDPALKSKLKFLAMGQNNDENAVKMWKAFHKVPFPVLPDTGSTFSKALNFLPYPVTVVLDKSGKIVWVSLGASLSADEALKGIKAAVK